jgi:hypothetical protein
VDAEGISFTEREYAYAVERKKIVLGFIHNDVGNVVSGKVDTDQSLTEKLESFRKKVAANRLVRFWQDRQGLRAEVIISLHKAMSEYPAVGWMRADTAASEDLLSQINKLRVENEKLRSSRAKSEVDGLDMGALASIDSKVTIRYTYQRSILDNERLEGQLTIDWKTIFLLVAPQFLRPVGDGVQSGPFVTGLKERAYIPRDRDSVYIYQTDLTTIEVQLIAYGLLTTEIAKSVGGGANRFRELTPAGRQKQIQWSVVLQN